MNMDRPDDYIRSQNSAGDVGPQDSSDSIAQNPKDIGTGKTEIHAREPGLRHGTGSQQAHLAGVFDMVQASSDQSVPALAARVAPLPDQPWTVNSHTKAAQSPGELLASVLRFKWTCLLLSVLVSGPLIALIWTQTVLEYNARAQIRVRPFISRLVWRTDDNGMIPFYDQFVNTQVTVVRSPAVLLRVLDQQEVQETQWYKKPTKSLIQRLRGIQPPPLERLKEGLIVRPRPRTEIIDVSFTDPSASDAKVIVDSALDQYMKYIREKSDEDSETIYRELLSQYQSLENDIRGREKSVAELGKSVGTELPQELISTQRVRLFEAQAQLSQLQQRIAVLQWEKKQASASESNDVGAGFAGGAEEKQPYYNDEIWCQRDLEARTIQHQIASSVYAPNHPARVKLTKDLTFAEESRQRREVQLDEQWEKGLAAAISMPETATPITGLALGEGALPLEHQLARLQYQEQLLKAELDKQQAEFKNTFDTAQSLQIEKDELRHKRTLFEDVRRRLVEKDMERNAPGSVRVLTRAYAPSEPTSDRRLVFTAMALFAGLGLGGGAAFLRASRNQAIYAPKDMPQPMQAPFLGYVPLVRTKSPPGKALWGEITQNQVLLVESIRLVRTALLSRLNGKGTVTMLVTSAAAGTGKSSFTKILGKSMAQAGRKVLMVDADFHKRTLSTWFNLSDAPGFMDSLRAKSVAQQNIVSTEVPGLSVMPVGTRGERSLVFEEISNGAFRACMEQLSTKYKYDIILLDGAPLLPVADSTILAGQVDGTIMVERESLSQRTNVADALARLGSTGGRLLGTVFVGSAGRGHYGYAYNYYQKSADS